jgi:hypothetical protein
MNVNIYQNSTPLCTNYLCNYLWGHAVRAALNKAGVELTFCVDRFQRQRKAQPVEAGDTEPSLCTSNPIQNVQWRDSARRMANHPAAPHCSLPWSTGVLSVPPIWGSSWCMDLSSSPSSYKDIQNVWWKGEISALCLRRCHPFILCFGILFH